MSAKKFGDVAVPGSLVQAIKGIPQHDLETFLLGVEFQEARAISGCSNDQERMKVQVRTSLVGELRNFLKSLQIS